MIKEKNLNNVITRHIGLFKDKKHNNSIIRIYKEEKVDLKKEEENRHKNSINGEKAQKPLLSLVETLKNFEQITRDFEQFYDSLSQENLKEYDPIELYDSFNRFVISIEGGSQFYDEMPYSVKEFQHLIDLGYLREIDEGHNLFFEPNSIEKKKIS